MCPLWNFENEHLANLIAHITDRAVALKKKNPPHNRLFQSSSEMQKR